MSSDPEQIRREIERTRSDLSDNVNALGDKVNPGSIARRQVGRVRGAAVGVKDAVMGTATEASDQGRSAVGAVGDAVADAPSAVARRAQGSPIAAGVIAFGVGMLVSSMLPATQAEKHAAQAVKDTAEPLVNDLTDTAKQVAENLQEPARHALDEVKTTASDAADTVQQETTAAVGEVKDQAMDSKDTVQQAVS